jgi:23S rRNA (guanosine2251-2'-O)-methyltransferase
MKTSAGTAGKIPIIRVHDTNQGIKDLKLAGFKLVALNASAKKTLWQETFDSPTAFIIGNEGRGVHPATLKKCDKIVMLPMQNQVESLNASVTAALVAYEWQRRKLIVE